MICSSVVAPPTLTLQTLEILRVSVTLVVRAV
jgi:hypothetical protein